MILVASRYENQFFSLNYVVNTTVVQNFDSRKPKRNSTPVTSFYYAITPARDNWFQTNQQNHELDDCPFLLALLMRNIWHISSKIWSSFVCELWFQKTNIKQDRDIGSCEILVIWFPKCVCENLGQSLAMLTAIFCRLYSDTWAKYGWLRHASPKTTVLGLAPKYTSINGKMHHQTLMAL